MKAVIQRVCSAHVVVDNATVGQIDKGLLILLGICHEDSKKECAWLAEKIANLRIFTDENGKMNLSIRDCQGKALVISQFTLYANAQTGRRPDFMQAAPPEIAKPLYEEFINTLEQKLGQPVATGIFGAKMAVHLINDGPVTIILNSELKKVID